MPFKREYEKALGLYGHLQSFLEDLGTVAVLGGAPRDWMTCKFISGRHPGPVPNDIDITIATPNPLPEAEIQRIVKTSGIGRRAEVEVHRTSLGGLRIRSNWSYAIDIWRAQDSEAFRLGLTEYKDITSCAKIPPLSVNQIMYFPSSNTLLDEGHRETVESGVLRLNLDYPHRRANISSRAYRFCRTLGLTPDPDLRDYMKVHSTSFERRHPLKYFVLPKVPRLVCESCGGMFYYSGSFPELKKYGPCCVVCLLKTRLRDDIDREILVDMSYNQ